VCTADVESLYTNVDTPLLLGDDGLLAEFLLLVVPKLTNNKVKLTHRLIQFIIEGVTLIIKNNYFTCGGKYFKQKKGIAMGAALSVCLAQIFLFMIEYKFIYDTMEYKKLITYYRYFDDIFMISKTKEDVVQFVSLFNSCNRYIKVKEAYGSNQCIPFLDTEVYIDRLTHRINTRLYIKPMHSFNYIPYKSFHSRVQLKAFIRTELIRITCISSKSYEWKASCEEFYQHLIARGYPCWFLNKCFNINYKDRHHFLYNCNNQNKDNNILVLKLLQHPLIIDSKMDKMIMNKVKPLLKQLDNECRPISVHMACDNLRTILIRATDNRNSTTDLG
jgi:hypothetical protein